MPKPHLYLWEPVPIFKARVNMSSVTYPVSELTYDGVTLGAFGDVAFDATLLLGTAEGLDDLGRVRVKSVPDADSIPVARASRGVEDGQLDVQDNAYITILDDYRVWAKIPYFDLDAGIDYKDGDVPPGTFNTDIPPVSNTGPGFADYIDENDVITVQFPPDGIDLSYAVADGATLTGYAWDIGDGTLVSGALTDATITATFPAGRRYVALTVTDSNGVTHTSRCPVLAVDPADDGTIKGFSLSQRLTISGQTLDIDLHEDAPRTTYPDGTLTLFWWDSPADAADRSHMKFIGWLDSESFSLRRSKRGLSRSSKLHAVDGTGRLAKLPGFPQALERIFEEAQWSLMPSLDMSKAIFYVAFWHSTLINVVDFFLPEGGEDIDSTRIDVNGSNLKNQLESLANRIVPDHFLCCNSQGQISFLPNWLLQDEADRPEVDPILIEEDYADLQGEYDRQPKFHSLRSGAILVHTELIFVGGVTTVPLVFSIAPSDAQAFGQGTQEQIEGEGYALSQDALNICEGHRYAMLNSRHGRYSFTDPRGNLFWSYEPALLKRLQLELSAEYAAQRGLDWTVASGQVQEVSVQYRVDKRGTAVKPTVTWTKETFGYPAITFVPEETDDVDYTPPPLTPPPDSGLIEGQQLVAGIGDDGYVYRTSDFQTDSGSGGPTWDRVNLSISSPMSWVVDPFSPGYIDGVGSINGWVVNATDIYRVEDLFGTPLVASVHTFAVSDVVWRSIQASFGQFFETTNPWLLCVSHYHDATGHTGTWALRSLDGGGNWESEVQISPHYDTAAANVMPIGIYLSPKTPGLAYTAAHTATIADAIAVGYVSSNWGQNWAVASYIETGAAQAGSIHVPWPNNDDESVVYHGQLTEDVVEGTDPLLMPAWASYDGTTLTQLGNGPSSSMVAQAFVSNGGSDSTGNLYLIYGPPPNAVRVNSTISWSAYFSSDGGFGSRGVDLDGWPHSGITRTSGTNNFTDPPSANSSSSGSFDVVHERNDLSPSASWPINNDNLDTWTFSSTQGVKYNVEAAVASVQAGHSWTAHAEFTWTITEIELEDGTIYTPVEGSGARAFKLQRVISEVATDISPLDGSVSYGINHYGFSVRSYDSDRQFMAMGGIGNDTGTDKVGLWVSENAGTAWVNIYAPVAASNALYGLQIAFSGSDPDILFTWGGYSNGTIPAISYSDDFGATLDSREGNINSLGTVAFIGIAGGPS